MKRILIFIVFLFAVLLSKAQNGDCSTTTVTACNGNPQFPFTSNSSGNAYGNVMDLPTGNNISNPSTNPASSNSGCLFSGESSGGATWVIIYVSGSGNLDVAMTQSGFQDWAMWPYNSSACNGIVGNTLPPIRCNWNSSSSGGTGIGPVPSGANAGNFEPSLPVTAGQAFIMCVTNFSSVNATINMNFTGTANLSCVPFGSSSSQTICPLATATLVGSTNLGSPSYTWEPGGLNTATINVSPTSTTIYTLTTAGTNTVSNTFTTQVSTSTVTVRTPPTLTLSSNSYVCPGSTINLFASSGFTNYAWSGPASYSASTSSASTSISSASYGMAGTYTLIAKSAQGGCSVQATSTVGVVSTSTITVQPSFTVCQGLDVELTANASGASGYKWSGPLSFTSAIQNPTITAIQPNQSGVYAVVASFTAGAQTCTTTNNTNIMVTPATTVALAALPTICNNGDINLNAPSGANTYLWTGPNGFSSSSQNAVVNNADLANMGTYNLTLITNGCVNTGSLNVIVFPPLSFNVLPNGIALCETKIGKLISSGTGGSGDLVYTWSPITDLTSPSSPTTNVVGSATRSYTLSLSDGSCPITIAPMAQITVTVNPIPTISFTTSNSRGCEPFSTDLISQSNPASSNCMWRFSDGNIFPACSSGSYSFPFAGNYGAVLTVTDINGCIDSVRNNAFILVDPKPSPDFSWNPSEPTILQNNLTFYDNSTIGSPMISWNWNFGDNYVSSTENISNEQNPLHTYDNVDVYPVSLEVTNSFGCTETITKLVNIENEFALYAPNAFSPQKADGLNDVFKVTGLGFLDEGFELTIYDRWGEKIFKSNDIKEGWDGKIKDGNLGETGIYQYRIVILDYKHREKVFVGNISLL